jgi:hypothetical protein
MWEVGVEVTEHISILMRAVDEEEIDWAVPALSNLTRGTHQGANILKQVEPLQVLPKFPEERAFAEVGIIAIKSIYTIDRFLAADTSKCKTGSGAYRPSRRATTPVQAPGTPLCYRYLAKIAGIDAAWKLECEVTEVKSADGVWELAKS